MEDEELLLSGIQHFAFCRRQWALIHIEQQWAENVRTVEGNIFHRNAHDGIAVEVRCNKIIMRGLQVSSKAMNVTGVCDVVEFNRDPNGIALAGYEGLWSVCPVEYKKGEPKPNDADRLQLCGQAMCLEEMLSCAIPNGYLFYGEPHRREAVEFTPELRACVKDNFAEMHDYFRRGYTPSVKLTKSCNACSLKELCLPKLKKSPTVSDYIRQHIKEDDDICENC